mmetsp:Transcript_4628/g.9497  ORF Transcript_4628/g.9497 Transcript_4628/m.9497 type:complete len:483 (+) Transcript_4628:335-1783(+)
MSSSVTGLSVLSYNVLLPNSQDGWWNYKMYLPPLSPENEFVSTWEHRRSLLRERIGLIDADVVCFQEVSPLSFEQDFAFMAEEGYDGVELFRKGRFRPATFWKKDRVELVAPAQHKDRTMLTAFRILDREPSNSHNLNDVDTSTNAKTGRRRHGEAGDNEKSSKNWHVLNCHLQAGKQGGRRVRQIVEGVGAAVKLAKKLQEKDPSNINLVVCGDFNGGTECGAVQYLESGSIGPDFFEDGEQVSSKEKILPLSSPLIDVYCVDRDGKSAPPTLVVSELISIMIDDGNIETCFIDPEFSEGVMDRFKRIYNRFATLQCSDGSLQMDKADVEAWLTIINKKIGRGTEFRNAAKFMGWVEQTISEDSDNDGNKGEESKTNKKKSRPPIRIPNNGVLQFEDFIAVYRDELRQGKFWGIAWDLAQLGEPLQVNDIFGARYDRMYCSASLAPLAVIDTLCNKPCPNESEPSDHLPIAATFQICQLGK